jgi:hypothetical protein
MSFVSAVFLESRFTFGPGGGGPAAAVFPKFPGASSISITGGTTVRLTANCAPIAGNIPNLANNILVSGVDDVCRPSARSSTDSCLIG